MGFTVVVTNSVRFSVLLVGFDVVTFCGFNLLSIFKLTVEANVVLVDGVTVVTRSGGSLAGIISESILFSTTSCTGSI